MRTYTTAIAMLMSLLFLVTTANAQTNLEGLREINSQNWDRVEVRPNMVFTVYTGIILGDVRIAFRTPDRSQQQFPCYGYAIAENGDMVTKWEGIDQLRAQWASTTRSRLDTQLGSL